SARILAFGLVQEMSASSCSASSEKPRLNSLILRDSTRLSPELRQLLNFLKTSAPSPLSKERNCSPNRKIQLVITHYRPPPMATRVLGHTTHARACRDDESQWHP